MSSDSNDPRKKTKTPENRSGKDRKNSGHCFAFVLISFVLIINCYTSFF